MHEESSQVSLDEENLIKIGLSWFSPSIVQLLKYYKGLEEFIESTSFFKLDPKKDHDLKHSSIIHAENRYNHQHILPYVVQTSISLCMKVPPRLFEHIKFNNLQQIYCVGVSITNIQCLSFIDLSNLTHLTFDGDSEEEPRRGSQRTIKIRSIKPLIKGQLSKLTEMDFRCGNLKSMGRDVSRMQSSYRIQSLYLQKINRRVLTEKKSKRDQDMSIWAKYKTKEVEKFHRLSEDTLGFGRVQQNVVGQCLKRKFVNMKFRA